MTFHAASSLRRLCAATTAVVGVAAGAIVSGTQQPAPAVPRGIAVAAAVRLCEAWTPAGAPVSVSGPGLKWQRPWGEDEATLRAATLVREIAALADVLVAARGQWVVVHDRLQGAAVRLDCATSQRSMMPLPHGATSLDVSDGGAVAALAPDGIVVVPRSRVASVPPAEPVRIPRPPLDGTGDLVWTGDQLRVFGASSTIRIDIKAPPAYTTATEPLVRAAGDARLAFWHNASSMCCVRTASICTPTPTPTPAATRSQRTNCRGAPVSPRRRLMSPRHRSG